MAAITRRGTTINTVGHLPGLGQQAPPARFTTTDLNELSLADLAGKTLILNIFPSIDTPTCAKSVRRFNAAASTLANTLVLCVSADLPFAQAHFCGAEGLDQVRPVSTFRHPEFGTDYGVTMIDGPLRGLLSRAIVVIDGDGIIRYTEQVPEIAQEPDYEAALKAV